MAPSTNQKIRAHRNRAGRKSAKGIKTPQKLRSSIVPGTVLILLSGGFRGKRVVFLKQMERSGLLLVTGPFCVNGVPLRRVNQRYVIATSTRVDISKVNVAALDIKDEMFSRSNKEKRTYRKEMKMKDTGMFVEQANTKAAGKLPEERKKLQKTVDAGLTSGMDQMMTQYLKTRFSLRSNMVPHAMKF